MRNMLSVISLLRSDGVSQDGDGIKLTSAAVRLDAAVASAEVASAAASAAAAAILLVLVEVEEVCPHYHLSRSRGGQE